MKILKSILLFVSVISIVSINAQTDAEVIKTIYKQSLTNGKSYDWLNHLSNQIGSRLSGSLGAERAVAYTKEEMEKLGLDKELAITTFQSRFGKAEWLKPYTDATLETLPSQGIKNIAIVSPAFSADCLETLEELEEENPPDIA